MKIKVKIHANSSQEKICKLNDKEYEVWIKKKPVDGKANLALEKMMTKYFGKKVNISSGFTSRNKIVEIDD